MKRIMTIAVLTCLNWISTAQEVPLNNRFCEIDNSYQADTIYLTPPSVQAQLIIDTLLRYATVSKGSIDFYAADVEKAIATFLNGRRVVYFNEEYLSQIEEDRQTRWTVYFVLAHELAHHTNMDMLNKSKKRKNSELEADCIAGKVLGLMGATKKETLAITSTFNKKGTFTYPPSSARRQKVFVCWRNTQNSGDDDAPTYKLKDCPNSWGELKIVNKTAQPYKISLQIKGYGEQAVQTRIKWETYFQNYQIRSLTNKKIPLPKGNYNLRIFDVNKKDGYDGDDETKLSETITIQNCMGKTSIIQ